MKKLISAAIIMVMAFAATASANYTDAYIEDLGLEDLRPFTDVQTGHPNMISINHSWQFDFVQGYPDGTFGPDKPINRAELIKIMVSDAYNGDGDMPDPNLYHNCFNDVNAEWYAPYICWAYEQGYVEGYEDGTFRPANPVNRVEALKIIMEIGIPQNEWPDPTDSDMAVELPVDIIAGQWYEGYARMAIVKELVDGQHVTQDSQGRLYYYPGDNMTRKEVVEMVWRIALWVVERMSYAQAMAELGCGQVANPEMDEYSEDDKNRVTMAVFGVYGFDQDEVDSIINKYYYDSVGDAYIEQFAAEKCGPGVEYDNWIFEGGLEGLDDLVLEDEMQFYEDELGG